MLSSSPQAYSWFWHHLGPIILTVSLIAVNISILLPCFSDRPVMVAVFRGYLSAGGFVPYTGRTRMIQKRALLEEVCTEYGLCRMQLCPLCNTVRRTRLHMQKCPPDGFAYAVVSARTLLHNAIVSARTHLHIQLCPPPCKNRPCSKLNALGRRYTFVIFSTS